MAQVMDCKRNDSLFSKLNAWILIPSFLTGTLSAVPAPFMGNWMAFLWAGILPIFLRKFPRKQARWGLQIACFLLGFLAAHQWTSFRLIAHKASLLPGYEIGQTFKIQAKVKRSWNGAQGPGAILTDIQVSSPASYVYEIERLTAYFPDEMNRLQPGSKLVTWITLKQSTSPHTVPWPMQTFWETYQPRYSCSVKSLELLLDYQEHPPDPPSPLNPGNRELLSLFLQGQPSQIWRDRLQPFGLGHLLAISGLHCLIVFLGIQALCIPLRKPLVRISISCTVLFLFGWHMGWGASVTRATCMLVIWTLLPAFNLPRSSLRMWGLLLCISLIWDPLLLFSQGFWYTFSASLGLLLGTKRRLRSPTVHPLYHRLEPILPLIGAQFMVLPVHILFGIHMPLAGFFWNLFGSLFLFVLLGLFVFCLLAKILPGVAALANGMESGLGLGLESLNAVLPSLEWVRFPHAPMTVFLCLFLLSLLLRFGPKEWRWYGCMAVLLAFSQFHKPHRGPQTYFLDVGQGLAILHVGSHGEGWLFDAGGRLPRGFTFSRVLQLYGALEIRGAFLSHQNLDHYQLLQELNQPFPVYIPRGQEPLFRHIGWLRAGKTMLSVAQGDCFKTGEFDLQVLAPLHHEMPPDTNEGSMVVLASASRGQFLITGDAGHWLESRLRFPSLQSRRLLQVGHHGSKTATGHALLHAFQPDLALISAGQDNPFGHPHPGVLERLDRYQVEVHLTSENGTLALDLHDP